MAKPTQVEWKGKLVPARQMEVRTASEPWAEYVLEDGSVVRVRVVVSEIMIATHERVDTGDPLVLVKSATMVAYRPPEEPNAH